MQHPSSVEKIKVLLKLLEIEKENVRLVALKTHATREIIGEKEDSWKAIGYRNKGQIGEGEKEKKSKSEAKRDTDKTGERGGGEGEIESMSRRETEKERGGRSNSELELLKGPSACKDIFRIVKSWYLWLYAIVGGGCKSLNTPTAALFFSVKMLSWCDRPLWRGHHPNLHSKRLLNILGFSQGGGRKATAGDRF